MKARPSVSLKEIRANLARIQSASTGEWIAFVSGECWPREVLLRALVYVDPMEIKNTMGETAAQLEDLWERNKQPIGDLRDVFSYASVFTGFKF